MQFVPITTNVVSSNPPHGEVCSIQLHVNKFVSYLWRVGGFLRVCWFPPRHSWNIVESGFKRHTLTLTVMFSNTNKNTIKRIQLTSWNHYHVYCLDGRASCICSRTDVVTTVLKSNIVQDDIVLILLYIWWHTTLDNQRGNQWQHIPWIYSISRIPISVHWAKNVFS